MQPRDPDGLVSYAQSLEREIERLQARTAAHLFERASYWMDRALKAEEELAKLKPV